MGKDLNYENGLSGKAFWKKVTFEQRLEEGEGSNQVASWRAIKGRDCELVTCLAMSRVSKEVSVGEDAGR